MENNKQRCPNCGSENIEKNDPIIKIKLTQEVYRSNDGTTYQAHGIIINASDLGLVADGDNDVVVVYWADNYTDCHGDDYPDDASNCCDWDNPLNAWHYLLGTLSKIKIID